MWWAMILRPQAKNRHCQRRNKILIMRRRIQQLLTANSAAECRNANQLDGTQKQQNSFVLQFVADDPAVVVNVADLTGNCHTLTSSTSQQQYV